MDNRIDMISSDLFVVTETADGEIYSIRCKYIQDLIDDWHNECVMCPANDARVFFAAWNYNPFNPYDFCDFESFVDMLIRFKK